MRRRRSELCLLRSIKLEHYQRLFHINLKTIEFGVLTNTFNSSLHCYFLTVDARRSKESVVNQRSRPTGTPFSLDEVSINFSKQYQVPSSTPFKQQQPSQQSTTAATTPYQRKDARVTPTVTKSHITVKPESTNGQQKISFNNSMFFFFWFSLSHVTNNVFFSLSILILSTNYRQ